MVRKSIDSRCNDSPTKAHHYIKLAGAIWRCKYCWTAIWLPKDLEEAILFNREIGKLGFEMAYSRRLSRKPKTRDLLAKLEEIRLLRKVLPEDELSFAIAAIINEKATQ